MKGQDDRVDQTEINLLFMAQWTTNHMYMIEFISVIRTDLTTFVNV